MIVNEKYNQFKINLSKGIAAKEKGEIDAARGYFSTALSLLKRLEAETASSDVKEFYKSYQKSLEEFLNQKKADCSNSELKEPDEIWFKKDIPHVKFSDVKGLDDAKAQIAVNIFAPIHHPEVYKKYRKDMGARIMFYGPPGTGKTFLAEAIAGEMQCKLAVVQAHDIMSKWVGDSEKNINAVFEEANQYDRCIIFFDELDAICSDREDSDSRYTKGILTTLLAKMDGFAARNDSKTQLRIIIAATNRPWALDSAVKRGKRFDTLIYIGLPDLEARRAIIEQAFKLSKDEFVPLESFELIELLAKRLEGYSGADINAICTQIVNKPLARSLNCLQNNIICTDDKVTLKDCEEVIKNFINSIKPSDIAKFDEYRMAN